MAKKANFMNINVATINNAPFIFDKPEVRKEWKVSVPADRENGAAAIILTAINDKLADLNKAERKRCAEVRRNAERAIMSDSDAEKIRNTISNDCINFDTAVKDWLAGIGVDITPAVKNSLLGIALASDSCILSIEGMEKAITKSQSGKPGKAAPDGWRTKDSVRAKLVKGFLLWAVNGRKALIAEKADGSRYYTFKVRGREA